jgi:hypothetical protein
MMYHELESLIKHVKSNTVDAIINENDDLHVVCNKNMYMHEYILSNDDIKPYLTLLILLDEISNNKKVTIEYICASHCLMDHQLANEFVQTITQLRNINISIEKLLCRFTNYDTIINIINNITDTIDYCKIFDELMSECSYNVALIEYIVSNNYVNCVDYDYGDCWLVNYHIFDILLSKNIDIIKKINYDENPIQDILKYISISNLKYFSNVPIHFDQYCTILSTLDYDKLEEFMHTYNTENIIYHQDYFFIVDCVARDDDRIKLLMDSGVNFENFIKNILRAIRTKGTLLYNSNFNQKPDYF